MLSRPWRFVFLVLSLICAGQRSHASVGSVLSVSGFPAVTLKSDASQLGLGPGFALNSGDLVSTDEKSTAKIHLIDETILDVNVLSRIVIPRLINPDSPQRQVLIQIERGKVRAKVTRELERSKGRFEIHTQAAAMGVEGTDFVVDASPAGADGIARTTVTVIEGQVALRMAKDRDNPEAPKLVLTAGMSYTAAAKIIGEAIEQDAFKPEDIKKLEQPALDEIARAAKLNNEAFLQAISVSQGPGGFGAATLHAMNRHVVKDALPPMQQKNDGDRLFRKNFRDDQFNDRSNFVNISIGFPQ